MSPNRTRRSGVVCRVQLKEVEKPTTRDIRYLYKLVDELASGKVMDKILRG